MITLEDDIISISNLNCIHSFSDRQFSLIQIQQANQFHIYKSYINELNYCNSDGSLLNVQQVNLFIIENVKAHYSCGKNGGIFSFKNANFGNDNMIRKSIFYNNTAKVQGGVIHSINSEFSIYEVEFVHNNAKIGGAIRFKNHVPQFFLNNMIQFQNNQDDQKLRNLKQASNIFQNNTGIIFGSDIGVYPTKLLIKSYEESCIINQSEIGQYVIQKAASGEKLPLIIQFIDITGGIIAFDPQQIVISQPQLIPELEEIFNLEISSPTSTSSIIGKTTYTWSDFKNDVQGFQLQQFQVVYIPGQMLTIIFSSKGIRSVNQSDSQQLQKIQGQISTVKVQFRQCIRGEIYQKINGYPTCYQCPQGKYSLQQPDINNTDQKCDTCPKFAETCYKDQIILKNGFWRDKNDKNQLNAVECSNRPQNCQGLSKNSKNYCIKGHVGPLCEECDIKGEIWGEQYTRDGLTITCYKCSEKGSVTNILKLLVILGLEIWFIQFTLTNTIKNGTLLTQCRYIRLLNMAPIGSSSYQDKSPFFIKQFFHYLSLAKFCNQHKFEQGSYLTFVPGIFSSPVQILYYIFDCFMYNQNESLSIVYKRTLLSLTIPLIYASILFIMYTIFVSLKKYSKFNGKHIFNGCMFFITYTQPGLLSSLLKSVNCRTIADKTYIAADLTFICGSDEQIRFTYLVEESSEFQLDFSDLESSGRLKEINGQSTTFASARTLQNKNSLQKYYCQRGETGQIPCKEVQELALETSIQYDQYEQLEKQQHFEMESFRQLKLSAKKN